MGELYDRLGSQSFGLAYHMLGDRSAAEDVVQEVFVAIWRNASRFDPARGGARTWVLAMVRYRCIDILRGSRETPLDEAIEATLASPSDDVWTNVLQNLDAVDVQRALADLPDEQQTTIQLAFWGGLTHSQIAAQLRLPLGTVKGRMRLALTKLREELASTVTPRTVGEG